MSPQWWKRLIVASSALAAAGILACGFAVLHVLAPIGSMLDFLAGVVLLGLVVVGAMIGYSWLCDKCEDMPETRLDRILAAGKAAGKSRGVESARRPGPEAVGDRPDARDTPQQFRSRGQSEAPLRGFVPPDAGSKPYWARTRHGQ